jgi:hypothetical protein
VDLPFRALPAQEVLDHACLSGEVSYNYTYLFDALVAECGLKHFNWFIVAILEEYHDLEVKGVHVDAHMTLFVGLHIMNVVQWVASQVLRAVERGFPELELPQILVENDGFNVAGHEKAESEDEEKDDHQILPPVPTYS